MITLLDIARHKGVTIQKIVAHLKESFGIDIPCSCGSIVPDSISRVIVPTIFSKPRQTKTSSLSPQHIEKNTLPRSVKNRTSKSASSNTSQGSVELRLINSDPSEMVGIVKNILSRSLFLKLMNGGLIEAPLRDLQDLAKLKIGDVVCVQPIEDEDKANTKFSVVYALPVGAWQLMKLQSAKGWNTITGEVLFINNEKRYVAVNVFGHKAFLYTNQIPAGVNLQPGNTIEVVVEKVEVEGEDKPAYVTLSMTKVADFKAYLEREAARNHRREKQEAKNRDYNKLEVGSIVQCTVSEINEEKGYMIVAFGTLRGIIFKNQLFGTNIRKISYYFEPGDELAAIIIEKKQEAGKYKIKLRYQDYGSWDRLELESGTEFDECSIVEVTEDGVCVSLDNGLEGFLPLREITRMEYNAMKLMTPDLTMGPVYIKKFDSRYKSITLTRLPYYEEVWQTVPSRYKSGELYETQVIDVEDNRIWVKFEDGVESCLDRSELMWKNTGGNMRDFSIGEILNVLVTRVDPENQKVHASIRHLTPDPWEMADEAMRGNTIEVVVIDYKEGKHIKVETTDSLRLQGIINLSEVSWQHTSQDLPLELIPQIDDVILAKVIVLNKIYRRLNLSIRQLEPDPWSGIDPGAVVKGCLKYNTSQSAMQVVLDNGLIAHTNENFSNNMNGQDLEFKVVDCNRQTKNIQVSHAQLRYDRVNDMLISNFFKSGKF